MFLQQRHPSGKATRLVIQLRFVRLIGTLILSAIAPHQLAAQSDQAGQWPLYRGNFSGTGYSELSVISPENIGELEIAWSFSLRSGEQDEDLNPNSQVTPIVVNNVMYLPTVDSIVALNPQSGAELWRHPVDSGRLSRRGVAYWPGNDTLDARIIFTAGNRLTALSAESGEKDTRFGDNGEVDMGIPYISVPLVYQDLVIVGANTPPGTRGGIGNPRAFSAISGRKIWELIQWRCRGTRSRQLAIRKLGEPLGANAWPFYFTVDTGTDLLYLPLASPLPFAFGGDRAGDNLFANSIVAVDIHQVNTAGISRRSITIYGIMTLPHHRHCSTLSWKAKRCPHSRSPPSPAICFF